MYRAVFLFRLQPFFVGTQPLSVFFLNKFDVTLVHTIEEYTIVKMVVVSEEVNVVGPKQQHVVGHSVLAS